MPIRLGLIGAGNIVRTRHLPNLRRLGDRVHCVAVANRRRETAAEVAREAAIPHVYDSWETLVAEAPIDAVLIGAPPYLHRDASIAALERGLHVFCQARMAMDFAQAQEMAAAARRASRRGLISMLCYPPLFLSGDAVVRELLTDGSIGRVRHVVAAIGSAAYVDPGRPLHWRQQWRISGLNTLELGMVAEVLHRWLGPFAAVAASAATFTPHRPLPDDPGRLAPVERPDAVSIAARTASGALCTLFFSGVDRAAKRYIEIHGERGSLRYEADPDALFYTADERWRPVPLTGREFTWRAEADFIAAIERGTPPPYPNPTFEDGLRYMEFTEAVFRSAEEGREVRLPLRDPP
ncbi:MAG TPA: Gfo/Idh/MocA family oxidoreductase [Limnochordia bacterium]